MTGKLWLTAAVSDRNTAASNGSARNEIRRYYMEVK